ncbi:hypothetical protein Z959_03565 [Clostridium novyi B str. ATCC 27606]|uniref:YhfM-like domain-containing protein n=1 Tax=Clostridium novyi B str. ATCC 27606 TaxID=1443123 RepID=A0AA40M4M2_CLONO|nr:hypothetical protein [Clostridium novyi]KEI12825.1 hypothetical protein Z959_03565 [Clostridium novyi B str. ATCC 27606]KEI13701.1 hypothetical protein Z958_02345 [Clostridium novyi B str. NCTC 9691]
MKKSLKKISLLAIMIFSISLMGCTSTDAIKLKMGFKNKDFEYIKEGRISKVVVQNNRDKGFTFIMTDKNAVNDLYDILSKAKVVDKKITLKPDYTLEFHEGLNKVHKFNYIAGLDKKDAGNLYGDNKIYIVSKRLDDDIMKNFYNIRIPNDFKRVYYTSIINAIKDYRNTIGEDKKIGIDLNDEEVSKFVLTMDVQEFKEELGKNDQVISDDDRNKYDITMDITTEGYKKDKFKCIIKFYDKINKKETVYYFINEYSMNSWKYNFTKDKMPEKF